MAIKTPIKSANSLRKEMIENISERSGVNYWARDGIARSLVDIMTSEQRLMEARVEASVRSIQVGTATGTALDAIAESKGLARVQPTFAQSMSSEKNVMFYSMTTFGDLNAGADIVIPKGTKLSVGQTLNTATNVSENNIVEYVTTQAYTLPATMSAYFCSVRAVSAGSFHNVAENTLINHNFTNYQSGQLYCKNNYSILNGRNIESDESLRFRVANIVNTHAGATEIALQMAAIEVPGVTKIEVVSGYFGIGTAAAFVFAVDNEANQALVNAVQRRINSLQTPGLRIIAMPGVKVHFDFEIVAYIKSTVSGADRTAIENEIKRTISTYFFNGSGDPLKNLSMLSLEQMIVNNPRLAQLASVRGSSRNMFNKIYIRRSYGGSRATGERVTLDANTYSLEKNEYGSPGTIDIVFEEVSGDN